MIQKIKYNYDNINDILYIDFIYPLAAYSEEVENGIFLRINPKNEKPVGLTIFSYKNRKINDFDLLKDFNINWNEIKDQTLNICKM